MHQYGHADTLSENWTLLTTNSICGNKCDTWVDSVRGLADLDPSPVPYGLVAATDNAESMYHASAQPRKRKLGSEPAMPQKDTADQESLKLTMLVGRLTHTMKELKENKMTRILSIVTISELARELADMELGKVHSEVVRLLTSFPPTLVNKYMRAQLLPYYTKIGVPLRQWRDRFTPPPGMEVVSE